MDEKTPQFTGKQKARVIVIDRRKKPSADLEDLRQLEEGFTRVSRRVLRALDRGLESYQEARSKSGEKAEVSTPIELGADIAEGLSATLEELSALPRDLAKSLNDKRTQRLIKRQLRILARLGRLPR